MKLLKKGSKGSDVKKLQTDLNKLGARPKLKVDGIFGPLTQAAVKVFQKKAKLKADGDAGPLTQGAVRAGGPLPEMPVPDYKGKLKYALVAKAHNKELAAIHDRFVKSVDQLEDELKVQVPKAVKLLEQNQKHWDDAIKIYREIVGKQAEFEALRLSHPNRAKKLGDECRKLEGDLAKIKAKVKPNQQKADPVFVAARKKVKDLSAKVAAELKVMAARSRSQL